MYKFRECIYRGINSKLQVKGVVKANTITMDGYSKSVTIGVVLDGTMLVLLLVDRDVLKSFNYRLTNSPALIRKVKLC